MYISIFSNHMEHTQTIYEILRRDRDDIRTFPLNFYSYNELVRVFTEIKQKYSIGISDVLMGRLGTEFNKRKAFHMIPSIEFMELLYTIQTLAECYTIADCVAGTGLFSHVYNQFNNDKTQKGYPNSDLSVFDEYKNIETSALNLFPVSHEPVYWSDCIYVYNMPHISDYGKISRRIVLCAPLCVVLVIHKDDIHVFNRDIPMYRMIFFPSRMITCYDYIANGEIKHESIIIVLSHINHPEISRESILFLMSDNNANANFGCQVVENNGRDGNDRIYEKILPEYARHLDGSSKINIIKKIYNAICKLSIVTNDRNTAAERILNFIEKNIGTLDGLHLYLSIYPFPPSNCDLNKYNEFLRLCVLINEDEKKIKDLPMWVTGKNQALLYAALEYDGHHSHILSHSAFVEIYNKLGML